MWYQEQSLIAIYNIKKYLLSISDLLRKDTKNKVFVPKAYKADLSAQVYTYIYILVYFSFFIL